MLWFNWWLEVCRVLITYKYFDLRQSKPPIFLNFFSAICFPTKTSRLSFIRWDNKLISRLLWSDSASLTSLGNFEMLSRSRRLCVFRKLDTSLMNAASTDSRVDFSARVGRPSWPNRSTHPCFCPIDLLSINTNFVCIARNEFGNLLNRRRYNSRCKFTSIYHRRGLI